MTTTKTVMGLNRADAQTYAKKTATGAALAEFVATISGKVVKEGYVCCCAQGVWRRASPGRIFGKNIFGEVVTCDFFFFGLRPQKMVMRTAHCWYDIPDT